MYTVEKDGVQMTLNSEIQLAAFVKSGWTQAEKPKRKAETKSEGE